MIKSSADAEYTRTKDSHKGRDYATPFISFYDSAKSRPGCKTMCISYNGVIALGFPTQIDMLYDDETKILTVAPTVDGKISLYKFSPNRNYKSCGTVTRFLDYCGLAFDKIKGRYYGKIVDGTFVCELYEK